jgi:hypothetical protein
MLTFYLKNYKSIHHIVFIAMTFGFIKLLSLFINAFDLVFTISKSGLFLQAIILIACYFLNEMAMKKAGLTDEYMSNELDKAQKKGK